MDCSLLGSSVPGISRARTLEWVVIPPPEDFPDPGTEPVSLTSPALAHRFFTTSATWNAKVSLNKLSDRDETSLVKKKKKKKYLKKILSPGQRQPE